MMVASHFPQDLNPFQVYAHEATITALRAEVESLQAQLAAAESEVDDKSDVGHAVADAWENRCQELEQDLAAVRTDLSVARTRISDLEIEIACLTVTPVASSAPASPISLLREDQ